MPRKYTRKPRHRSNKKRSPYTKGGSGTVLALKTLTAPDRMLLKMPYYTDVAIKSTTSSYATWAFNLNSIYDPDRSGIGHQPLGYDQWGIFYNRYRVYGVQFDVTLTNMSDDPCRVYNLAANETPAASTYDVFEQSHMKSVQLAPAGSGKDTYRLKKFYSLPRIIGRPKSAYTADDRFSAQWNNNPVEAAIGQIGAKSITQSAVNVLATVRIIYLVEAFDKHPMTISNTQPELRGEDLTTGDKDCSCTGPTGPTGPQGESGLWL